MIKEKEYLGYRYDLVYDDEETGLWGFVVISPNSKNEIYNSECKFQSIEEADNEAKRIINNERFKYWFPKLTTNNHGSLQFQLGHLFIFASATDIYYKYPFGRFCLFWKRNCILNFGERFKLK